PRTTGETQWAQRPDLHWTMDFIMDYLDNGTKFRTFDVLDECTRECLAIEVDRSLTGKRVVSVLEGLINRRAKPDLIRIDNGPEFISKVLKGWAKDRGIELRFIPPGEPQKNPFIESFHGKYRDECLNGQ